MHSESLKDPKGDAAILPTATEAQILRIWRDVLKTEDVGLHDCFFDVGGNSLSATLCINAVRSVFDVELPLDAFFLEPASVASVSQLVDRSRPQMTAPDSGQG